MGIVEPCWDAFEEDNMEDRSFEDSCEEEAFLRILDCAWALAYNLEVDSWVVVDKNT